MKKKMKKSAKGERFNPHNLFYGVFIPEVIVSLPVKKLSQGAKIAYGRLCRYAGKDGEVFPRRDTLSKEVGCSTRQIDSYLNKLKKFGLIESERVGLGMPNKYYFVWHEIFDGARKKAKPSKQHRAGIEIPQQSETDSQDTATHSIKESQLKRVQEREDSANAESLSSEENTLRKEKQISGLVVHYQQKINSSARLTNRGSEIIRKRLCEFSFEELVKAIDNFSKQNWYMENHSFRGMSWFFKDEDQVMKWLSMHPPKGPRVITI